MKDKALATNMASDKANKAAISLQNCHGDQERHNHHEVLANPHDASCQNKTTVLPDEATVLHDSTKTYPSEQKLATKDKELAHNAIGDKAFGVKAVGDNSADAREHNIAACFGSHTKDCPQDTKSSDINEELLSSVRVSSANSENNLDHNSVNHSYDPSSDKPNSINNALQAEQSSSAASAASAASLNAASVASHRADLAISPDALEAIANASANASAETHDEDDVVQAQNSQQAKAQMRTHAKMSWYQRLRFKFLRKAMRIVYLDVLGDYCVSYAECRKDRDKYFPEQEPYLESTAGCRFLHTKMVKTEFHCCQYCKSKRKLTCNDHEILELEQELMADELGLPPNLMHLQKSESKIDYDAYQGLPLIKSKVVIDSAHSHHDLNHQENLGLGQSDVGTNFVEVTGHLAPHAKEIMASEMAKHQAEHLHLKNTYGEDATAAAAGKAATAASEAASAAPSGEAAAQVTLEVALAQNKLQQRLERALHYYNREPQMIYHEVDLVEAKRQALELQSGLDGESNALSERSTDLLDSKMTCRDAGTRIYLMADVDAKTRISIGWGRWWQSYGLLVFFFLHYTRLRNFLGIPLVAGLLKFDRFAGSSPDRPIRLVRLGFYCMLAFVVCMAILLSGCSSAQDEVPHEQTVKDPVSFEIEGVSGDLLTNVQAHIDSLAVISKSRVRFYVREISDTATKALRAYGYYNPVIHVNLPDKDKADDKTVVIDIDAGKPLYIRNYSVEILGEGSEYKAFRDLIDNSKIASYTVLDHGLYEKLKSSIHETALSLGFFDGKYISSRIMVYQDQNAADIELIYDSGKRYSFGELLTDPETDKLLIPVRSLKEFKTGEPFSSKRVNAYVQALTQTNYYGAVDVRPAIDKLHDYQVPLEVHLEPRAANNMRVGGGYSTDEGIRVLFEWNKPLLNERGDSFGALTTLTQVTQNASLIYKIPHDNPNTDYFTINGSQLHTELNDTISDRSQFALHYIADQTGSWRRDYALRFEYEDYDQASETGYAFNTIPHLRLLRRESSGGFDPDRGYSLMLETLGSSSIFGDNSFMQVHAVYKGIIAVGSNYRLFVRAEQGANFGPDADNVPPSLRFFAGGDNSIRGYGYRDLSAYQADGSGLKGAKYLTTGSIEYQFPIGIANSRGAIFLDGGLATDDYTSNDIAWGPGIGYRFLSPYGTVRVDFAVGLQGGEENRYQLHFAFGPEF